MPPYKPLMGYTVEWLKIKYDFLQPHKEHFKAVWAFTEQHTISRWIQEWILLFLREQLISRLYSSSIYFLHLSIDPNQFNTKDNQFTMLSNK